MKGQTTILLESVSAQLKAEAIIESCETCDHFKHALEYVHLYFERFKDPISFEHLMRKFFNKRRKCNCSGY